MKNTLLACLILIPSLGSTQTAINVGGGSVGGKTKGMTTPTLPSMIDWSHQEENTDENSRQDDFFDLFKNQWERFFEIQGEDVDSLKQNDFGWFDFKDEMDDSEVEVIWNYQDFLNHYTKTGEIGNNYVGFYQVNMYHRFIEENHNALNEKILKTLSLYWNTDLTSPARLPQYQFNPKLGQWDMDNFNRGKVDEDIKDAVLKWHGLNGYNTR